MRTQLITLLVVLVAFQITMLIGCFRSEGQELKGKITYALTRDVNQYPGGEPQAEGYHLTILVENVTIPQSGLKICQRTFHWAFETREDGLEVRRDIRELKVMLGGDGDSALEEVSKIVTEVLLQ